jgi:ABC-2 type transport system ATP-binding protein
VSIGRGETIGLLGRNGAGKSTLLRMLAGVSQPTEGTVTVRGRIAPLISVGVGFHPEMSGRENVYVNGMLLGLTRTEIEERFDDIVAFAEVGEFIDTPVKFYSSGMFLRLGFSVAIHTEPDVLLVDEILAVGDVAFQLKCFDRMAAMQSKGMTIALVSHSAHAIRLLCPRVLVFSQGQLVFDGDAEAAIGTHYRLLGANDSRSEGVYLHDRVPSGVVAVLAQELYDADGNPTAAAQPDVPLTLRARLQFTRTVENPQLLFVVRTDSGSLAYRAHSTFGRGNVTYSAGDEAQVEVPFQPRFGGGGTFAIELVVTDGGGGESLGRTERPTMIYVTPRAGIYGLGDLGAEIYLDGQRIDEHAPVLLGRPIDDI